MLFCRKKRTYLDNIIYVDVDDTIADTRRGVHEIYKTSTGMEAGDIKCKSKRYSSFCPAWDDAMIEQIFKNPGKLYDIVKPMPGADKAIKELMSKGYDVRVVTLQSAEGVLEKEKWIRKYFPALSDKVYYITNVNNNKDVFSGKSIIDDDYKNIEGNSSCMPILLDIYGIYENKKFNENYASSWQEAVDKLK